MKTRNVLVLFAVIALGLTVSLYYGTADAEKAGTYKESGAKPAAASEKNVKVESCYMCHAPVKDLHKMGKHEKLNCASCHSGLERHLGAPGADTRPGTDLSWLACAKCHREQYESFMKESYHRPARDEKSQLTNRSPNPFWDKLMMGHGFTKEHALTRSHNWMLIDHLIVDRAYGGRFQGKNGWQYIFEKGKAWDVLIDKYPNNNEHKAFIPQSASAANPVCLQCKTQDQILKWAYMGDPVKGATWSRTSNVVEFARDLQHGLNCYVCHDPHAAKPRIVRDGLIDALTRPDADTLWHKDPNRTKIKVIDLGVRGYNRKIALLENMIHAFSADSAMWNTTVIQEQRQRPERKSPWLTVGQTISRTRMSLTSTIIM